MGISGGERFFHANFSWTRKFAALTNRKLLGVTLTSVKAVLHTSALLTNKIVLPVKFRRKFSNVIAP